MRIILLIVVYLYLFILLFKNLKEFFKKDYKETFDVINLDKVLKEKQEKYIEECDSKGYIGEEKIYRFLKFYDNLKIFRNVYIPDQYGEKKIDLILIHKTGVYVIGIENIKGWIFGSQNQKYWNVTNIGYKSKINNPIIQNSKSILSLQNFFDNSIKSNMVYSYIVFEEEGDFKTTNKINTKLNKVVSINQFINEIAKDFETKKEVLTNYQIETICDKLVFKCKYDKEI